MHYCVGVILLLALPGFHAFSLRDLEDSSSLQHLKEEILAKHPDLVTWFERAGERLKSGKNATEEDLDDVRNLLKGIRKQIYDFVTSPMFTLATNLAIEKSVDKVKPLLGVFPLKEIKAFYDIVRKDPEILKTFAKGDGEIVEAIPVYEDLAVWLMNSTQLIMKGALPSQSYEGEEEY